MFLHANSQTSTIVITTPSIASSSRVGEIDNSNSYCYWFQNSCKNYIYGKSSSYHFITMLWTTITITIRLQALRGPIVLGWTQCACKLKRKRKNITISIVLGPSSFLHSHFVSCQLGLFRNWKDKKKSFYFQVCCYCCCLGIYIEKWSYVALVWIGLLFFLN
jgi:hypothetical protein